MSASLRQEDGGSLLYLLVIIVEPCDKLCFGTSDCKMTLSKYILKLMFCVRRVLRLGCHFDRLDGLVES